MSNQDPPTGTSPTSKLKRRRIGKVSDRVVAGTSAAAIPSTSTTLSLPSDTTVCKIRSQRTIVYCPDGPPAPPAKTKPEFLLIFHPANNLPFIQLPAFDQLPGQPQFGVHYETVITACRIVACNRPGYLSKSRRPNVDRIDMSIDSVLLLLRLQDRYYYHVDDISENDELYPVCDDFRYWRFPHGEIPSSWLAMPKDMQDLPPNWTELSQSIKTRDNACLISGYTKALSTAHVVNKEDNNWLEENNMILYLNNQPLHQSQRNLFCLRYDLYLPLFDQGCFAIVPKCGKLVVHFLRNSAEYVNQFHNVPFEHNHNLSHEALYARFAWAVMKIVKDMQLDLKAFKISRSKGKHSKSGHLGPSRMGHEAGGGDGDDKDNVEGDDGNEGDDSGTYQPPHSALQHGSWLYDVLHKMAPGDKQSLEADECEIKKDLMSVGRIHPFLVDSSIEPTAYNYENIVWYPGIKVVEKRKQAYLDSHPNIRACGGD